MDDCEKLKKVVQSCKTKEQLMTAWKYYKLWDNKYPIEDATPFVKIRSIHISGWCWGYFLGWADRNGIA